MASFRPRPQSVITITILISSLFLSACNTRQLAEALADTVTANSASTSEISGTPDNSPADSPASSSDNSVPVPVTGTPMASDSNSSAGTSTTFGTSAIATDIQLSWSAPAEREDNKPIALSEIAAYKIYYGTTAGNYINSIIINDGSVTGYTFTNFPAGTYYFAVTVSDTDGRESKYSTEVKIII